MRSADSPGLHLCCTGALLFNTLELSNRSSFSEPAIIAEAMRIASPVEGGGVRSCRPVSELLGRVTAAAASEVALAGGAVGTSFSPVMRIG